VPDVYVHTRTASDVALVIATDGIWDEIANDEAGTIVQSTLTAPVEVRKMSTGSVSDMANDNTTQVEEEEPDPTDDTEERMVKCARVADKLIRQALMKGSFDNMVAVVIQLDTTDCSVSKRLFV
jgi:serine/threonine protein phosphatase PrpC